MNFTVCIGLDGKVLLEYHFNDQMGGGDIDIVDDIDAAADRVSELMQQNSHRITYEHLAGSQVSTLHARSA